MRIMPEYVGLALMGAVAMALSSLMGKLIVRYRICDAGLLTWGQGIAVAVAAAVLAGLTATPFPVAAWRLFVVTAIAIIAATWMLNHALQEGDVSTVVPLMGTKIPITALLAVLWMGESASGRIWFAVILSGAAVALFGVGKQRHAEGGHGRRPGVAILLALAAASGYAVSDVAARQVLAGTTPFALVLWLNILWAPISGIMLARPYYRQYRVTWLDAVMLLARGLLAMVAVMALYAAFDKANGVIVPNIVFGFQGFFALIGGWLLNRTLSLPLERQSLSIYCLRILGTVFFFVVLILVVTG